MKFLSAKTEEAKKTAADAEDDDETEVMLMRLKAEVGMAENIKWQTFMNRNWDALGKCSGQIC